MSDAHGPHPSSTAREKAAAEREAELQKARNEQLEASLRVLAQER